MSTPDSAAPTEAPPGQTRQAASSTMGDSPPGSPPLSSTKTPRPSPVKQSDQSGHDNSPAAKPKIFLKLNLSKTRSPAADAAETDQLPNKRKRAMSAKAKANKKSKLAPTSKISASSLRLDMSNNPPPAADAAETDQLPAKRGRAMTAAQATKKPRLIAAPKNFAPKIIPTTSFTDGAVVAYGLRQIYDAIPELPKEKLQMIWVSIEKRREVFELVQELPEFRKATLKVDCARQLHSIKPVLSMGSSVRF